jgi:DNA repair protein RadC
LRFLGHILVAGDGWAALQARSVTGAGGSARGTGRSSRAGSTGAA